MNNFMLWDKDEENWVYFYNSENPNFATLSEINKTIKEDYESRIEWEEISEETTLKDFKKQTYIIYEIKEINE